MEQTTNLNWFSCRISEPSTVWCVPMQIFLKHCLNRIFQSWKFTGKCDPLPNKSWITAWIPWQFFPWRNYMNCCNWRIGDPSSYTSFLGVRSTCKVTRVSKHPPIMEPLDKMSSKSTSKHQVTPLSLFRESPWHLQVISSNFRSNTKNLMAVAGGSSQLYKQKTLVAVTIPNDPPTHRTDLPKKTTHDKILHSFAESSSVGSPDTSEFFCGTSLFGVKGVGI